MTGQPGPPAAQRPSGIVLAGGRATRFGADKLAAPVAGRPLLHRPIEALADVCGEVVIVVGREGRVPPLPAGLRVPLRVARDETAGGGPLVGLIAGLAEATGATAIVAGGDMPGLVPGLLVELERRVAAGGATAAALVDGDRIRPLPCAMRRAPALAAARALLADGRTRLRDVLDALGAAGLTEAEWRALDPAGRSLIDIDRPGDLARLGEQEPGYR